MNRDSVKKNYIYNLLYQILTLIIPLITTPYISRVLNAELIGQYNYTNSIVQYYILFACLGTSLYAQREIAYAGDDVEKRSKVFYEIQIFTIITFIFIAVFYSITVCRITGYGILYKLQAIYILSAFLDIGWFFQGLELFKITVLRNIIVKIAGIVLIFTCVQTAKDFPIYVLILCCSTLLGNITVWFYLPKYLTKVQIKSLNIRRHIRPNLVLFLPQIASQVYLVFDKTMIGFISTSSEVGCYAQGEKIVKMAVTVLTSLGVVMMPRVAAYMAKKRLDEVEKSLKLALSFAFALGIPMTSGLAFIAPSFVPWFLGQGYDTAIYVMIILAPLAILVGLSGITGTAFLIPLNMQKQYTISVVIGAFINLILNALLIKSYGACGASISIVIAESGVTIIQFYFVQKKISIKSLPKMLLRYLILCIPMSIFLLVTSRVMWFTSYKLLVRCFLAITIYFITLVIADDDIIRVLKNKLVHKSNKKDTINIENV